MRCHFTQQIGGELRGGDHSPSDIYTVHDSLKRNHTLAFSTQHLFIVEHAKIFPAAWGQVTA
jgi:hypothetical protein